MEPLAFCSLSSLTSATALTACSYASFTGTANGTILYITGVTGFIPLETTLAGIGVPAGTIITGQTSGPTGGAGTYTTNIPTTASAASLTAGGIPAGANYAVICAYVQGVVYRDDGGTPTGTPGTGGQGIAAGQCISYNSKFTQLQFIQQASGAILGISFYR